MVGDEGFEAAETVLDGGHGGRRWEEGSAFLGENVAVQKRLDGVGDAVIAVGIIMTVEQIATADWVYVSRSANW